VSDGLSPIVLWLGYKRLKASWSVQAIQGVNAAERSCGAEFTVSTQFHLISGGTPEDYADRYFAKV